MGKELFDRALNGNPALSRRIVHGTPDDDAENMTFDDLIGFLSNYLASVSDVYVSDYTVDSVVGGLEFYSYGLRKFGKVVSFSFRFKKDTAEADNVFTAFCHLPLAVKPSGDEWAPMACGNGTETGQVKINGADGWVLVNCGAANQVWHFNMTWILP